MRCTFGDFAPGTDNDPDPTRTFDVYLDQFRQNSKKAGETLHPGVFAMDDNALAKVEGDVFELIEAAALWNAFAAWNRYMETGAWTSGVFAMPNGAIATPTRCAAILKLPRGYDTTLLFKDEVRRDLLAFEKALELQGMELGLSSPDIVGIRLPHPATGALRDFFNPILGLDDGSQARLRDIYKALEGTLEGRNFLFAVAVKRTTRSDRLYQPLFEANVLKFLIEHVLRGAAFRFYVHMGSLEGADVERRYRAASLTSLIRGGQMTRAIDAMMRIEKPTEAAQAILNDLPLFPL